MKDECEYCGPTDKVLNTESIVDLVICVLVTLLHEINGVCRRGEEEDLHDGVVKRESRVPGLCEEKIEIAGAEDNHIKYLGLQRDTCA